MGEISSAMETLSSELSKSSSESSITIDQNMSVEQLDMAKRRKSSTSKDITEKRSSLKETIREEPQFGAKAADLQMQEEVIQKNNRDEQRRLEEAQRKEEEEMLRLQRKERESRER